ncbi:MAG: hypothetical protein J0M12_08060 [Deltaproteobacteria bacterium]|nr:hypothetical protein [Deltaproteobacteria bacterium]
MKLHEMQAIQTISDTGKGRPFVILHEDSAYELSCVRIAAALGERTRTILLRSPRISDTNWRELTELLQSKLKELSIRQASFVGFGAAGALVQNLCLADLKMVRTVAFVDAASRAHASFFSRCVERVERSLPLGLPLRRRAQGFDSKPYLQRIRCPALVITTPLADAYIRAQAEVLEMKLPTSWRLEVSGTEDVSELSRYILEFQEVPARCPQKNVSSVGA